MGGAARHGFARRAKTAAHARENLNISALPTDAIDEINGIQTRQRLNEVVKPASRVSSQEAEAYESETIATCHRRKDAQISDTECPRFSGNIGSFYRPLTSARDASWSA